MSVYRILYLNSEGADFHNVDEGEEEEYVKALAEELGDSLDEVEAFVVGIPDNPTQRWYIENICLDDNA